MTLLVGASPAEARAQTLASPARILNKPVAVYPYGATGTMTSAPDGSICYAAEGGAIAILNARTTSLQDGDKLPAPLFRGPVGSRGVVPIDMVLDPDANPGDPTAPNNYIYIAGGRDGLWAMDAEANGSAHSAYRIDDSGNLNSNSQFARRWANDVEVITVKGPTVEERFVVFTSARIRASRLRLHKLSDVRAVCVQGSEFLNEISPYLSIWLDGHTSTGVTGNAYAFGMGVDELPGDAGTDIYVAMGTHGIVKVHLHESAGSIVADAPIWGPFFGSNSPYASDGPTPQERPYRDRVYREGGTAAPAPEVYRHAPFFLDVAVENRGPDHHRLYAALDHLGWCSFNLEAPWTSYISGTDFFHEGTIHQDASGGFISEISDYVTYARHVRVVETRSASGQDEGAALVVSGANSPFINSPMRMNEGRSLDSTGARIGPVISTDFASDLRGPHPSQTLTGPINVPMTLAYDLGTLFGYTGATPNNPSSYGRNEKGAWRIGIDIHLPKLQADGQLEYFANGGITADKLQLPSISAPENEHNLAKVLYNPFPPATVSVPNKINMRDQSDRQGRIAFNVGPSAIDPALMVTSSNDNGMRNTGALVLDLANKVFLEHFGTGGGGDDNELTFGVLMNTSGGKVTTTLVGTNEYRVGAGQSPNATSSPPAGYPQGVPANYYNKARLKTVRTDGGSNILIPSQAIAPAEHRVFARLPRDKFLPLDAQRGRYFQGTTAVFPEYDQYLQTSFQGQFPSGFLWVSHNGTPQGIWVLDADRYAHVVDQQSSDDQIDLYAYQYGYSPHLDVVIRGALTTHPEFWNIPDERKDGATGSANFFINAAHSSDALVGTFYPAMMQLPSSGEGPDADRWVLAVPAGRVTLHENFPEFAPTYAMHSWAPDEEFHESKGYDHMMIRLFDVTDPNKIESVPDPEISNNGTPENGDSPMLTSFTLIGPDVGTNAIKVQPLHYVYNNDGVSVDKYLLFVADFGGWLYVYDMTDLFTYAVSSNSSHQNDPHYGYVLHYDASIPNTAQKLPILQTRMRLSLSDEEPNNIHGLQIDKVSFQDQGNPPQMHEKVFVYLGVTRVGVEILDFQMDASGASLTSEVLVQTPGEMGSIEIVPHPTSPGDKLLFVADYPFGLRVYEYSY